MNSAAEREKNVSKKCAEDITKITSQPIEISAAEARSFSFPVFLEDVNIIEGMNCYGGLQEVHVSEFSSLQIAKDELFVWIISFLTKKKLLMFIFLYKGTYWNSFSSENVKI